jgi:hypothetical protein
VIELAELEAARERIAGAVVRTPLVRLHVADAPPRREIWRQVHEIPQIESGLYEESLATLVRKPTFDPCVGLVKEGSALTIRLPDG